MSYWDPILHTEGYSFFGLSSGYSDSSSQGGPQSTTASKNIVSERNRRKKLYNKLLALRAVVPNISKMDKASIIKDAIDYIQMLHDQEKTIQSEITELESRKSEHMNSDFGQKTKFMSTERSKKKKIAQSFGPTRSRSNDIEVLELSVRYVPEKIVLVNLTCNKRSDTIMKLCEVFESLKLKIVTATISSFSERLSNTLFIQAEEEEMDLLKIQIERAILALNGPHSPMSM